MVLTSIGLDCPIVTLAPNLLIRLGNSLVREGFTRDSPLVVTGVMRDNVKVESLIGQQAASECPVVLKND